MLFFGLGIRSIPYCFCLNTRMNGCRDGRRNEELLWI